ncbi:hypothetical protein AGLY_001740 [Aphis glycines]|uniref:t-SNARE coiled-coil homology domain-containing protein n=1 Tax=Aphis glycines TaxID=307491 RepID=A0A6G0U4K1_APHGL|nr:hypothetical protein AGLY_001740 [Aphis glycines]
MANIYMMLRNKSKQSIHPFKAFKHKNYGTDSKECVNDKISLMEAGRANEIRAQEICPPPWTGLFEDARYSITCLQNKLEELRSLQDAHLLRSSAKLNDSNLLEKYIRDLTFEITRIFTSTKKTINQILLHYSNGLYNNKESQLSYNESSSLMLSLQNIFNEFRNSQKDYRKKIKRLECVSLQTLFETEDNSSKCSLLSINEKFSSNDFGQQLQMLQSNQTRTFAAILVEEENAKMAVQLESKANQMASTIVELNNIFKEVTHMTYQQGSVLDRIDYNIKQAEIEIDHGVENRIESENCHNRKIKCILVLVPITFVLLILFKLATF